MKTEKELAWERWLITIAVMLAAVIEVLDATIVNVSLPAMMGSLGADTDQITWVLTSYIVSAAIFMPLTGFLVSRLGRRKLLLLNIGGFLITSVLCGFADSLFQIVLFRTLQGIFGASLIPLSQVILRDTFPREQIGKAMAIWGIGIMAGPVLGPTLGGYITDTLNWRWVFFINVPVCILAFIMSLQLIKETPVKKQAIDWKGLLLMATGVGCLQLFLDRGNTDNWFESNTIIMFAISSVAALSIFIWRGLKNSNSIVNLNLFKDRYFASACVMLTFYTMGLFGSITIQPIMMEQLLNYPTTTSGLVMAPRGFASAFGMMLVAKFINRWDARWFIALGLIMSAVGTYLLSIVNLSVDAGWLAWAGAVQGFGMGLFFVPLSSVAFNTISKQAGDEAAGLFGFSRSIGTSIGISIMSTLYSRGIQSNWNQLGGHISKLNPNLHRWLLKQGLSLSDPVTIQRLAAQLGDQASILAFVQIFQITALAFALLLPLVWAFKPVKGGNLEQAGH